VSAKLGGELVQLPLAPDQAGRRDRQVRLVQRLERREVPLSELVEALRSGQVLEPVLTQVTHGEPGVEQVSGRPRHEHLAAVAGAHYPCTVMDVDADVALLRYDRLARVEPHPDAHLPVGERLLTLERRRGCVGRTREGDEERVPLGVDLDAAVARERLAQRAPVLCEHRGVAVAELMEQSRRALDISKEEGDGPLGELSHAYRIARRSHRAKGVFETRPRTERRSAVGRWSARP
jgi:hypothetical protein